MNGRYLLDTNIVIAIFGAESSVLENLKDAIEVFVPSIVIGELYYGAYKSTRVAENILRTEEFASKNTILICDTSTAQQYGRIKNVLRANGRPLPENDIWIAAIAEQHRLTLATRDAHFQEIATLQTDAW
ncbi:MAG TPA: type II toxin-antitoxin system VapC family toxin [Blastocatellia bacterium]|nr:type II toxin-antitoxin system VapC family toxin [Blastocatellia bacterium]